MLSLNGGRAPNGVARAMADRDRAATVPSPSAAPERGDRTAELRAALQLTLAVGGEQEYLTCERCGDYLAVPREQFDGVRELIERAFGYRASFAHFPVVGLCQRCAEVVDSRQRRGSWRR